MTDLQTQLKNIGDRGNPAWTPERAATNELAISRRTRGRATSRVLAGTALAVVVVVIAATIARTPHTVPLEDLRSVRYLDGSAARATTVDAQLTVTAQNDARVESELLKGGYRFDVAKKSGRTFQIKVADVRVEVMGTQFVVERLDVVHARVSVLSGRVRVAHDNARAELGDGESRVFPEEDSTRIAVDSPGVQDPSNSPTPDPPARAAAPKPKWIALAQSGDFDAAYTAMKRSRDAARSPAELMLAADAARLSRHASDAVAPLERLLTDYPNDARAPLAAFTLGRVQLDDLGRPREAARSFARARLLGPSGPIAEDALAREVESLSRSGDLARSQEAAATYLAKYPKGIHVRSVNRFGGIE